MCATTLAPNALFRWELLGTVHTPRVRDHGPFPWGGKFVLSYCFKMCSVAYLWHGFIDIYLVFWVI